MSEGVNNLQRNKWSYQELFDYFELIADEHVDILGFTRVDLMNLTREKHADLKTPFLALEDPVFTPVGNNGDNIQWEWQSAFVVLKEVKRENETEIRSTMSECGALIQDVFSYLLNDRTRQAIVDFHFNQTKGIPVKQVFRNCYGYRVAFSLPSQFDMAFRPEKWKNPTSAFPLPPFATVIDGADTIELTVGQEHICSTLPATVTLEDENQNELDDVSVAPGGTATLTAPNGSVTVNNNAFDEVLSGGALNVPVQYYNGTPTGTIDGGIVKIANPVLAKSVELSVSDANPTYGDVVTITQTPTNIVPTEYVFEIPLCNGNFERIVQAGNTYDWTVEVVGEHTVYGGCTDGAGTTYDADGVDVDVPVNIMDVSTPFLCSTLVVLNPAHIGYLLRAVRNSDLATNDFYPNAQGMWGNDCEDAGGTTIVDWAGAATCYMRRLYDTSGNARDGEQITFSAMPKIFEGGSVLLDGDGIPYADFDGTSDGFEWPDMGGEARMDVFIIHKIPDNSFILLTDGGRYAFVGQASTSTSVQNLWNTTALRIDGDVKNWSSRQDVLDAIGTNQKQVLESRDADLTAWTTFRMYNYPGWFTEGQFYGIIAFDYDSVDERLAIMSVIRNKFLTP